MKPTSILIVVILSGFSLSAVAQDQSAVADDQLFILSDEAQKCVLPTAPGKINEDPAYEELVQAKSDVSGFQADIEVYRACLTESEEDSNLTDGNRRALAAAYNYSVEMEERVANRFNVAVRAYKAKKNN